MKSARSLKPAHTPIPSAEISPQSTVDGSFAAQLRTGNMTAGDWPRTEHLERDMGGRDGVCPAILAGA
eukprot:6941389-Heterocapsa_arctica.AAC.1